jgi:hypothetical protein
MLVGKARRAAGLSLFRRVPSRFDTWGELVEATLMDVPIPEILAAVGRVRLDEIELETATRVLHRVLPDEPEVAPVEVAAFGSFI